jgi:hypothetical protein
VEKIFNEVHKPQVRRGVIHAWVEKCGTHHCFYRHRARIGKGHGATRELAVEMARLEAQHAKTAIH